MSIPELVNNPTHSEDEAKKMETPRHFVTKRITFGQFLSSFYRGRTGRVSLSFIEEERRADFLASRFL